MTNLWIKTPFPGETAGEGEWHECTTWYEQKVLYPKHSKSKHGLPTRKQEQQPKENEV